MLSGESDCVCMHLSVDIPINNGRFCSLKFPVSTSSMVHGFAGYFDTVLYNQITLSKYKSI